MSQGVCLQIKVIWGIAGAGVCVGYEHTVDDNGG